MEQSKASLFYVTDYVVKNESEIATSLAVIKHAINKQFDNMYYIYKPMWLKFTVIHIKFNIKYCVNVITKWIKVYFLMSNLVCKASF